MRFQSAIQGLSSMKSIPYMADILHTGLVQTKKADETLDRQTEKIRGAEGIRSPITYTLPLCPLILSMQTSK